MDIDVDVRGVNVDKQHIKRLVSVGQRAFVSTNYGVVQVIVFNESVVHEKVLLVASFFCRFGFANVAVNGYITRLFLA